MLIPIVLYKRCREEVTRLLSAGVVVVGHGIESDFGALRIHVS